MTGISIKCQNQKKRKPFEGRSVEKKTKCIAEDKKRRRSWGVTHQIEIKRDVMMFGDVRRNGEIYPCVPNLLNSCVSYRIVPHRLSVYKNRQSVIHREPSSSSMEITSRHWYHYQRKKIQKNRHRVISPII